MDYVLHLVILVEVFTILAMSLDIVFGRAGVLCIAHGALCGIGAYTTAVLMTHCGTTFALATLGAIATTALVSAAIALMAFRLRADYLAIGTLGVQMILFSIFNNWSTVTRGPLGIAGIPRPAIFGMELTERWQFAVAGMAATAVAYCVARRLVQSPLGRALHALREDEVLTRAMGKNTARLKIVAFAVSGSLAAIAGSFYACYISYIDPTSFTVHESILVLSMVIVGGRGTLHGPVVGAAILVLVPESLRFIGISSAVAANLRQILYGMLLVLMMLFRPQGVVGRYDFGRA